MKKQAIKDISKSHNIQEDMAEVLLKVVNKLKSNNIDYRLIGGLAVGVHSKPRSTSDVDFYISNKDVEKVKSLFDKSSPLEMGPWDGFTSVVDGFDIDFIYSNNSKRNLMQEPAKVVNDLSFLSLSELIYSKIISGRLKDINDISSIVEHYSGDLNILKKQIKKMISKYPEKHMIEEMQENLDGAFQIGEVQKYRNSNSGVRELVKKIAAKYK
jgi:hypothetical protein